MAVPDDTLDRLNWAERHLKLFQRQVGKALGGDSYVVKKGSGAKGEIYWELVLRKPFPERELGLIIGDVVHSLRSRLDHLLWDLAGSDPANRKIQFPICSGPDAFRNQAYRLGGLSDPARRLVRYLQPYRRRDPRDSGGLLALSDLDNMDKHRTIPVVLSALYKTDVRLRTSIDTEIEEGFTVGPLDLTPPGPFVIGITTIDPPDPKIKVEREFTFGVVFGDAAPEMVRLQDPLVVLPNLVGCVASVVHLFQRLEERAHPN